MPARTLPLPTGNPSSPGSRLHGLDWLRAFTALVVVALHAGIPYMTHRMPGLVWSTWDSRPDSAIDAFCWAADGFVMPVFFVMGGLLAAQLMRRKGTDQFLQHRASRLLGPLAFGIVFILPLDLYAWLIGWVGDDRIAPSKLLSLKLDPDVSAGLWGVSHLWFLQYLFVYCAAAWGIIRLTERLHASERGPRRTFAVRSILLARQSPCVPAGLLVATGIGVSTVALVWEPEVVIGFRHSWWPLPANLLYFVPCFAFGWWLAHRQEAGKPISSGWGVAGVGAIAAFFLALPLIHTHVDQSTAGTDRWLLAASFAAFAWLSTLALLGGSVEMLRQPPPAPVRFFAEASFWVYLIHHPIVGLSHVSLSRVDWPTPVRFAVVLTVALAFSLLTYAAFVRSSWIGQLLNGRRYGQKPQSLTIPQAEQNVARRAA
ncbi:Glucans biosynthesis protein C [Maioricimonas rarisocia]|uniref:Glucans biosynthesis protein C n=1 Tax=Maioricimonas rarisocia TaxID=2528026 RepID=A0A517Z8N3_9PLAN|nr:acyltransferase [Maioricimonas rarisocia]QDU38826.1 Glucans biosynthesis protein C [Maioricimonas rarisocia]